MKIVCWLKIKGKILNIVATMMPLQIPSARSFLKLQSDSSYKCNEKHTIKSQPCRASQISNYATVKNTLSFIISNI